MRGAACRSGLLLARGHALCRRLLSARLSYASACRLCSARSGECQAAGSVKPQYPDQNDTWVDRLGPRWASVAPFLKLTRVDRPIGTWLILLPGYCGLALAAAPGALPSLPLLAVFGAGAFVMRGAGCTINDIHDRGFDAQVARTSKRPLATGSISLPAAWGFLAVQLCAGGALLVSLPPAAIGLGVAVVPVVVCYPLLKRVTHWPQAALGVAMNWGVLMGWAAVHGLDGLVTGGAAALFGGGVLWTLVYDTIYAHQDKTDDARLGLGSTALALGDKTRPALLACAAGAGALWCLAGLQAGLAWPFFAACASAVAHMGWQVSSADYGDCSSLARRFKSNKWVGAALLAGVVAGRALGGGGETIEGPSAMQTEEAGRG